MVEIEKILPRGNGLLTVSESEKLEYLLTEAMMEGVIEGNVLVECAKWLTPSGYDGIVAERNCGGWCGYPRCRTQDVEKIKFVAEKKSQKSQKSLEGLWKLKFCSRECYKKSEFFKRQLSSEALFMRRRDGSLNESVVLLEEL